MTAALKNISKDTLLRMLSGLWPKYHAAREQEHMAWCMNDVSDARSWRKVREEHQRKINRVCGCLGIKPLECPTCGTIMRNTDREMLREDGKTLPFDPDTPRLEGFIEERIRYPQPSQKSEWRDYIPPNYGIVTYRRILETTDDTIAILVDNPKRRIEIPLASVIIVPGPKNKIWLAMNLIKKHGFGKVEK